MSPPHALNLGEPPKKITQEAHEGNPKHLRRLARLRPGDRPDSGDLYEYAHDLLYTEIQGDLFAFLLPFCLEVWRDDLRGQTGYGGFVEYLYPVLANRHVFDRYLTEKQTQAVSEFMRDSILEEIDEQRGLHFVGMAARPYRWFGALTTHGVLLPDIERLWNAWWSLETVGRAIAALQYVSCLMYSDDENPVFAPWTPDGGGGPPSLWEFAGHLYANRWLEPNVVFLKNRLDAQIVADLVQQCADRLRDLPERDTAVQILADLPLCTDTLVSRCTELPRLLATTQEAGELLEWSK